ncbi:MAG TPA: protoporphyrinogen oxidase, partial [Gemmatimonadaceae bacterium]|nr:protoporphyrinogen oxidase [Gemmatimonadaceae bacterium]
MAQHVIIIGGGITGLAALERLSRSVQPGGPLRVTLLEAAPRLGGLIRTDHADGFVMEAGPDVMLASKPAGMALCEQLGIADRLIETPPSVRGSYILDRGRLRRVPEGMSGLVASRLAPFVRTPLLSPAAKLRVALEYLLPARRTPADETVEGFVVRRLGRESYERLVEPLLSGIYAGDGARLSILATFPQLVALEQEHGGLLRGMLARRR